MAAARTGLLSVILIPALVSSAAAQSYNPVGPQTNVPIATVEDGGWVLCHSGTYASATGDMLAAIQAACGTGTRVMLACGPTGGDTLTLLSQTTTVRVFLNPGSDFNDTHPSNGAVWYHTPIGGGGTGEFSWGFAGEGADVERDNCDTETDVGELRLCWNLQPGTGGYRCGEDTGLDEETDVMKYIYTNAVSVPTVPTWQFVVVALLLIAATAAVLRGRRAGLLS